MRVAGSRPQGPVGQVSRGLGARAPRAWGPAHQGPGAFSPQKHTQTSQITIFRKPPGGSLAKAWVSAETAASEVGTWRETKPGYPPYPPAPPRVLGKGRGFSPSPPSATIQHAPQGRRIDFPARSTLPTSQVFTLMFTFAILALVQRLLSLSFPTAALPYTLGVARLTTTPFSNSPYGGVG